MSEHSSSSSEEEATSPPTPISEFTFTPETTATADNPPEFETPPPSNSSSKTNLVIETPPPSISSSKTNLAIETLSSILTTLPPSLLSSHDQNPTVTLLHNPDISSQIASLLRHPDSGAGDNNLCRWFYDTFQSSEPELQLVVLRFLPIIAGLYLSRVTLKKPLAGFEAVLLSLYAHETTARSGQSITVSVPDLTHPSIYHEAKDHLKNNNSTKLNLAVISPSLEPYGTVRSTRRARIVGVALELYYSKIRAMPVGSKIDFCEFCEIWSGQDGDLYKEDNEDGQENVRKEWKNEGGIRIPLPWELLQPVLRILGHCLLGSDRVDKELFDSARSACRSLYARSLHDINPRAILATESLLRLSKMSLDPKNKIDYTEIRMENVISL